jgi:putative methionine-R-sulfoxide reductase with GAF domain
MFEFLSKRNSPLVTFNEESQHIPIKEIDPLKSELNQMVDSFIKKCLYQGNSLESYSKILLSFLAREKEISHGIFFIVDKKSDNPILRILSCYAFQDVDLEEKYLEFGEGFPGQVAKDGNLINMTDLPNGYISIESGLGKGSPASLIIFPIKHDANVLAVIEVASFHKFTQVDELFFTMISPIIAKQILSISANLDLISN